MDLIAMQVGSQAVVIGGGIAGLLAAHVLTEHFEHVSLIERDHYPSEPTFRPGVPQGRHVHIMLLRGQHALEELFPGITEKLQAQGAIEYDFLQEVALRNAHGWLLRSKSALRGYTCTRLLIEWQIRQELLKNERLQIMEGREVIGLLASDDARSIVGVRLRKRGANALLESEQAELLADLVIDASGRDSHAPQWLQEAGYAIPHETEINAFLGYATRTYELPADPERDWQGLVVLSAPPKNLRAAVIWAIEGGHWMVVEGGSGRDYPPTDDAGFLEFARGLMDQAIYNLIKDAKPLTTIYGYRHTENRLRHFERLQRRPERFLVLGDAYCAFNPVYGQGMTVAALGATMLADCLRQQKAGLDGLASIFPKRLARVTRIPWQLATASDDNILDAIGEGRKISFATKLLNNYFQGLNDIMVRSPFARKTFTEVQHMIKSPIALFHPLLLWKVLTRKRT